MVIKTDLPSDEGIGAVAVDEDAAEVEAEVAPLLVCVTINCSIYTCCSGVNTGMGVPAEVCRDAIDWWVEAGEVGVVDSG